MERDSLQTIQSKFPGSSRALWSEAFPNDGCVEEDTDQLTEFIHSRSDRLNRSVVLLSLNPAAVEPPGYQNFHSPASKHYDYRLKEFIQDKGLDNIIGAYMTDIVPDAVDPDSKNIAPEEADTGRFLVQLRALSKNEYDIICFSKQAFEALQDFFDVTTTERPPHRTCECN